MEKKFNFIIVDDDRLVTMFCSMLIKKNFPNASIHVFDGPEACLVYLQSGSFLADPPVPTVVFLDINMPTMSGWDFLNFYEYCPDAVKNAVSLYILSSSLDERDKSRAFSNKYVKDYFVKPLTKEMMFNATHSSGIEQKLS